LSEHQNGDGRPPPGGPQDPKASQAVPRPRESGRRKQPGRLTRESLERKGAQLSAMLEESG